MRPNGLCNLAEVVVRSTDNAETLRSKVRIATIIGTFQSTLTNFRYLRPIWRKNAEEERLLGVSLTGIMDAGIGLAPGTAQGLAELKTYAQTTNTEYAERLGINPSVAITTVKPSGTVSQLVGSSSGIHPRHSEYYIRTVRTDVRDPIGTFLREQGVPCEPDVTKPDNTLVFSFPIASPPGSITRDQLSAIDQLDHYLVLKREWCEHNPSITVYVRESEWLEVGAWVYDNFDDIGGISFLPYSEHIYKQAPYQAITEKDYHEQVESFPVIDWQKFREFEDTTTSTHELACSAGVCELV